MKSLNFPLFLFLFFPHQNSLKTKSEGSSDHGLPPSQKIQTHAAISTATTTMKSFCPFFICLRWMMSVALLK
ncbi:hypothetical protein RchiOBHm_Chr1g0318311 [Rosa chinensis]|uniref:Uncharacterized protein n=1 Tax=Rosa chinensis TaxID=74649 RepID=A0A2P6S838_ROSCH|nr:hypothetical protein RchiOBHm_Chr1g0318311 [Rosa chinensis]